MNLPVAHEGSLGCCWATLRFNRNTAEFESTNMKFQQFLIQNNLPSSSSSVIQCFVNEGRAV